MNKTIYIRDEDIPIWDRAKELAGEKLAPVIMDGLRDYIARKEAEELTAKGFERIQVSFYDGDANGMRKSRAFYGKWIFPVSKPLDGSTSDDYSQYYAVAMTAKGAFVIIHWTADREGESFKRFRVYQSLEVAAHDAEVCWAAIKANDELGVAVEELDI